MASLELKVMRAAGPSDDYLTTGRHVLDYFSFHCTAYLPTSSGTERVSAPNLLKGVVRWQFR